MYFRLNSFKGIIKGITVGIMKGDTRSLDYGSYVGIIIARVKVLRVPHRLLCIASEFRASALSTYHTVQVLGKAFQPLGSNFVTVGL